MLAAGTLVTTEDGRLAPPKPVQETKGGLTRTSAAGHSANAPRSARAKLPKYPDSPLGKALEGADDKFQEYKAGKLTKDKYLAALRRALTRAISEAGRGSFSSSFPMKLLLAVYGDTVTRNELTAGPDDNGIDGQALHPRPRRFQGDGVFPVQDKAQREGIRVREGGARVPRRHDCVGERPRASSSPTPISTATPSRLPQSAASLCSSTTLGCSI